MNASTPLGNHASNPLDPASAPIASQLPPVPDIPASGFRPSRRTPGAGPKPAQPGPIPGEADSSVFMDGDPLKDLLLDKGVKWVGEAEDSMPEEVRDFMIENEFGNRYFQVMLKSVPEGAEIGTNSLAFIRSWYRAIPSLEYIARNYGPGRYYYFIYYKVAKESGKGNDTKTEKIYFEISDRFEQEYLDYQRERKMADIKRRQERVRQLKVDKQLDDAVYGFDPLAEKQVEQERPNVKEYVQEITGMAKELGLTRYEQREQKSMIESIAPYVPAIAAALSGFFKMQSDAQMQAQQAQNNMLMLLLNQTNKSNEQLFDIMKVQNGQGAGTSAIREYTDMVKNAVDLKEFMQGGKQTVADKVFGLIEGVLPQVLNIAAMTKAQQMQSPAANMAKAFVQNDPTFQAAMKDPKIMADVVNKLDDHYGWRQTDGILTVAGIQRPDECPRDPDKENPINERPESDNVGDGLAPSQSGEGGNESE